MKVKKTKSASKKTAGFNWFCGACGVIFGIIGSEFWTGFSPHWLWGAPFQALSAWLIWKTFPERVPLEKTTEKPIKTPKVSARGSKKSSTIPWVTLLLLVVTLLLAASGQFLFWENRVAPAVACWVLAFVPFGFILKKASTHPEPFGSRSEFVFLAATLFVAVLMRFPFIGQHVTGLQIDESNCIQDAMGFINGSLKTPFITSWGDNESFHFWWLSLFLRVFGQNAPAARAFSAVVSIGTLYIFYLWNRFFFGHWASLISTFLLSIGWWFLFYSLSPFQDMLLAFWTVTAFFFLTKALKEGRKLDYALSGLFIGFSEMEYLPGRLVGPMVAVTIGGILFVEGKKFWQDHGRYLLLTLLSTLWLAGPFIFYFFDNLSTVMGRSKELSLFNEIHRTGHYGLLFKKIFWTFVSFLHHNDGADPRFCSVGPMVDYVSGAFMVFGLVLVLANLRKRTAWFALGGFIFGVAANALAIQGPNPDPNYINGQRYFIVLPFLFFMVAYALDWLFNLFAPLSSRLKITGSVLLGALCAGALLWNINIYYSSFRDFKTYGDTYWAPLGFNHIRVADFLNANYPRCHILLDPEYNSSTVQILTRDRTKYLAVNPLPLPLNYKIDKNVLIVFRAGDFDEARIRQTYPNATWGEVKDSGNGILVKTVEVSKTDIEALEDVKQLSTNLPD